MRSFRRSLVCLTGVISVASLFLLLRASPAYAQVQNLCIEELDAGDTSTTELCTADQPSCTSATPACVSTGTNVDWNQIIGNTGAAGSAPTPTSGYGAGGQSSGVLPSQGSVFRQGTKILDPIATWVFSTGASPSKATLTNGIVASYSYTGPSLPGAAPQTGDEIIYYVVTRSSNNGSELQGTWFLVNALTPTPAGCTKNCSFIGAHATGDLFVLSTFTGGGGNVGLALFQWTGNDATGSLSFVESAQCSGANGSLACGEVNAGQVTNSFLGGTLATGLFYEGGVDVTQAFTTAGAAVPCFSNVLFESIASASCSPSSCSATNFTSASSLGNAEAKGFILGTFNTCHADVTKVCGAGSGDQSTGDIKFPISGILSNPDGSTLTFSSITDSAPGTISGDGTSGLDPGSLVCSKDSSCTSTDSACGACTTGLGSCTGLTLGAAGSGTDKICYQATFTADSTLCADKCKDTVTAKVTGPGNSTLSATAQASCSFTPANAGLDVIKQCQSVLVAGSSGLQVQVNTKYTVCNEQAAPLTGVTLIDSVVAGPSGACPTGYTFNSGNNSCTKSLTPSLSSLTAEGNTNDCATATSSYIPVVLPSDTGGTCPNGTFQDTGTATGQCKGTLCQQATGSNCSLDATTGQLVCKASGSASCPLCPLAAPTAFPSPTEEPNT